MRNGNDIARASRLAQSAPIETAFLHGNLASWITATPAVTRVETLCALPLWSVLNLLDPGWGFCWI